VPGSAPTHAGAFYRRGDESLTRPAECSAEGDDAIVFTGKGKWSARVRY